MKNILFLSIICLCALLMSVPVLAQTAVSEVVTGSTDYNAIFATFGGLVAIIPLVVEGIKKLFKNAPSIVIQIVSWVIGILITMLGWWLHLGFLDGMQWYIALAYGVGVSLAANGVADTGLIQWIISLFANKKKA